VDGHAGLIVVGVEKVCDALVGIVVFFSITLVMMPPGSLFRETASHVEQQHVLDVARQHAALDCRTDGHGFIRVHVLARLLAEQSFTAC